MTASLRTHRLLLVPLTKLQLQLCITDLPALETELGMPFDEKVITERVQRAIQMKLDKMTVMDESLHPWQTYWLIVLIEENVGAGLAGFKGVPDAEKSVEIGYGIAPSYQNKGYMTEAVKALVGWALEQPHCSRVTATDVENPASYRLLEKLGAHLVTEDESSSSWEFTR